MTARYENLFRKLKEKNEGAFVPFVVVGDPDIETSVEIMSTLIESGADALELGIPFSDPGSDGPVIQVSDHRAITAGVTPPMCFEAIKRIRGKYPETPIGLLMYVNLVYAPGIDKFYKTAAESGVDSILVADVPVVMYEFGNDPWKESAEMYGIDQIFIAPPNASDYVLEAVAKYSRGYTYLLSRAGVTGTGMAAQRPVGHVMKILRDNNSAPCLLGFGISEPEQVRGAIRDGADGAISGSAVVKIIEDNLGDHQKLMSELASFTRAMKDATKKA